MEATGESIRDSGDEGREGRGVLLYIHLCATTALASGKLQVREGNRKGREERGR